MNVYFMRHGETDWNTVRRLQGSTDIPLNGNGIALAGRVARAVHESGIRFDRVYTSPLVRAVKTAELMNAYSRAPLVQDARLAEFCFGEAEGVTFADVLAEPRYAWLKDWFHKPAAYKAASGAESMEHFLARIESFLDTLRALEAEAAAGGSNVQKQACAVSGEGEHAAATHAGDVPAVADGGGQRGAAVLAESVSGKSAQMHSCVESGEGEHAAATHAGNVPATAGSGGQRGAAVQADGGNVLVVCHGGVVRGFLCCMNGGNPAAFADAWMPNCALNLAVLTGGVFSVEYTARVFSE